MADEEAGLRTLAITQNITVEFPDGFECPELRLLEAKAFRSGITYTRYASP
jgi:hypothetical protein